jgi:osmotically-inducible protein OsmY
MMILSSDFATIERSRVSCGADDDSMRTAAQALFQSSDYVALRRLRCEVTDAVVIVSGILPSYFLKQMAQTVIQRLEGIQSVLNLVEVRQSDSCPSWENSDEPGHGNSRD